MDTCYIVILDGQLGKRGGILRISDGPAVNGSITLLGRAYEVTGTRRENEVSLSHELHTPVGNHVCRTDLILTETGFEGVLHTRLGNLKIHGTKTE